jgi:hypothetical protein
MAIAEHPPCLPQLSFEFPPGGRIDGGAVTFEEQVAELVDRLDPGPRVGLVAEADRVSELGRLDRFRVRVIQRRGFRCEAATGLLLVVLVPAGEPPASAFACANPR